MNILRLGKLIIENYFFMRALTRHIGEPTELTERECNKVFEDLKTNPLMSQKFALVLNIKTQEIGFHLNTEKFLNYKGAFNLKTFFQLLHPDFIVDYLRWAQSVYTYVIQNRHLLDPLNQSARITIPLKLSDGRYHWVLQEALPLQADKDKNLVTHLNIYTVLHEMDEKENVQLSSRLYNNGFEVKEWTQTLWKEFFTRRPFDLTEELQRIIIVVNQDITLDNKAIAEKLGKSKHTIDKQNKQILARARDAFPTQTFETIKDLVRFLNEIGYFDGYQIE